ncbi:MAG: HAMP domain-containing histidine kinase [Cyclobacteriaceae bacterium]|nr:HAMP domain-containing histidine kinase [Cyclobacteriaceae bacterium]
MASSAGNKGIRLDSSKSRLKWIVLIFSVSISIGSIYYTNLLVQKLKEREKQQIELFAKTLEYTINEETGSNIYFITDKILIENKSIPTILTNDSGVIIDYRNIDIDSATMPLNAINRRLEQALSDMRATYDPIPVTVKDLTGEEIIYGYVNYNNSFLLSQLAYYPYIQLSVIAIFGIIAYIAFDYSKAAEQNRVWVGLAKETAHQLGTPISSLMAWVEFLREDPDFNNKQIIEELDKDVHRLQLITERFSSIGSIPVLNMTNINDLVRKTMTYLRPRISSKVEVNIHTLGDNITANVNAPLFEWVLENLCKNAVDAMEGVGTININILHGSDRQVFIDVSDNGKGLSKSKANQVFVPGFTTKKRGWGLGLTLAKRIIETYHKGKIFVKNSEENAGTTFRISLPAGRH